jgi:hypothetical protein
MAPMAVQAPIAAPVRQAWCPRDSQSSFALMELSHGCRAMVDVRSCCRGKSKGYAALGTAA